MRRLMLGPSLSMAAPLRHLQQDVLETVFEALGTGSPTRDWIPAASLVQRKDGWDLMVALPGVNREDIDLSVDQGTLVIHGNRPRFETGEGDRWWMAEVPTGRFERRFQLPDTSAPEDITARYDNGLLAVHVPKAATPSARRIPIADQSTTSGEPTTNEAPALIEA